MPVRYISAREVRQVQRADRKTLPPQKREHIRCLVCGVSRRGNALKGRGLGNAGNHAAEYLVQTFGRGTGITWERFPLAKHPQARVIIGAMLQGLELAANQLRALQRDLDDADVLRSVPAPWVPELAPYLSAPTSWREPVPAAPALATPSTRFVP